MRAPPRPRPDIRRAIVPVAMLIRRQCTNQRNIIITREPVTGKIGVLRTMAPHRRIAPVTISLRIILLVLPFDARSRLFRTLLYPPIFRVLASPSPFDRERGSRIANALSPERRFASVKTTKTRYRRGFINESPLYREFRAAISLMSFIFV